METRYHLAEAIRINNLEREERREAIDALPLGTRTQVAVLAKRLTSNPWGERTRFRATKNATP